MPVFDDALAPSAVAALVARSQRRGSEAAFQALLAAVEEAVRGTLDALAEADASALNLAQQQRVRAVAAHLAGGADALHGGLSPEGLAMALPRRSPAEALRAVLRPAPGWIPRLRARAATLAAGDARPGGARPTWVAATAAAIEALGGAARHLSTLAAVQPPDSSARALAEGVAAQLGAHRDALLEDVARLME